MCLCGCAGLAVELAGRGGALASNDRVMSACAPRGSDPVGTLSGSNFSTWGASGRGADRSFGLARLFTSVFAGKL